MEEDTQSAGTVAEPVVDVKHAVMGEPIVGHGGVLFDERGEGARQATPLASPPAMTPAEKEIHDLTHLPYQPSCLYCATGRRPNTQHRRSHDGERTVPLLVACYGYLRDSNDSAMATALVIKLHPYRLCVACVVSPKGPDPSIVKRVARCIKE